MRVSMVWCNVPGCKWGTGPVDLADNLSFSYECHEGHKSATIYAAQRFEILFDMGMSALLDGYTREAVSSFAVAQERFHEFCVKVFSRAGAVPKSAFDRMWKSIANQSERQLGAFYFLYLEHIGDCPPVDDKRTNFRNRVVHKGAIPTSDEAREYACYVYNYIAEILKTIATKFVLEIKAVCADDVGDIRNTIASGTTIHVAADAPTIIWLSNPDKGYAARTFDAVFRECRSEHINELENRISDLENDLDDNDKE